MSTETPQMELTLPTVSSTPGPTYAAEINAALERIDSHDHTAGFGVPITPDGMSIDSDLSFGGNNATQILSARFSTQSSPLSTSSSSNIGCIYVVGADLYYNDTAGNQVRITQSGGVTGATGTITNLTSPASADYVSASNTFVWQSGVNVAANLDARSVTFRNSTVSSFGLTLDAPSGMAANYNLVLPAIPGTKSFATLDTSGNIVGDVSLTGGITGAMIATNTIPNLALQDKTITTFKVADRTLLGSNTALATIARANLTALGQQTIQLTGHIPSGSVSMVLSLATSGRPVMCMLYGGSSGNMISSSSFVISIRENAGTVGGWNVLTPASSSPIMGLGTAAAGTNVYDVSVVSASPVYFNNMIFTVYEL